MHIQALLKNFGLNDKEVAVYTALIELGPAPVRTIAQKSKVNRGTSYDILKNLINQGLVTYYDTASKQYFVAEQPENLVRAVDDKQGELHELRKEIEHSMPQLRTIFERQGGKPIVKFYEGPKGIRSILQDVLDTLARAKEKVYYVYSAETVRKDVYQAMPDFSSRRIAKKIRVRTIGLEQGGQLVGLDERKWLASKQKNLQSTYQIIYASKVAHISLDDDEKPVGVLIENEAIYQTQKMIFEFNWSKL